MRQVPHQPKGQAPDPPIALASTQCGFVLAVVRYFDEQPTKCSIALYSFHLLPYQVLNFTHVKCSLFREGATHNTSLLPYRVIPLDRYKEQDLVFAPLLQGIRGVLQLVLLLSAARLISMWPLPFFHYPVIQRLHVVYFTVTKSLLPSPLSA